MAGQGSGEEPRHRGVQVDVAVLEQLHHGCCRYDL